MTNKKLKMAAMSVALTACVAASPLAANADAPEAAPGEPKKEPVAEETETKKEENTAEPQVNQEAKNAQETLKDAEVKYNKDNPTTNLDGSQKLDGVIVTNPEGSGETGGETGSETGGETGSETGSETGGETKPNPNPDSGETNPNPNPDSSETKPGGETGSGETGSGETGSGETGGEAGSGETGSGETGSGETGSGETGSGETGSGETGSGETGSGETGSGETGGETGNETGSGETDPEQKKPEEVVIGTAEKTEKSETNVETKTNPGAEPIVDTNTPPTVEKKPDGSTAITESTLTPGKEITTTTGTGTATGDLDTVVTETPKEKIDLEKELGKVNPDISWDVAKDADVGNGYTVQEVENDGNQQTLKLRKEEETTAEMTAEDIAKLVDAEKPTVNPDGTYTLTRTETILDAEGNPQTRTTYITIQDNKVTTKTTTELTITREKEKQEGRADIPTDVVLPEVELNNGKSLPYTKLDEMLKEKGGKDANGVKDGEYTYKETDEDGTVREYTIKIDTTSTDQLSSAEIVAKLNNDRYSVEGDDIYYRADNGERVKLDVTQKAALRRNLSVNISVTETKKDTTEAPNEVTTKNEVKDEAIRNALKNAVEKLDVDDSAVKAELTSAIENATLDPNGGTFTFTAKIDGKTYTLTYTGAEVKVETKEATNPDVPGKNPEDITDVMDNTVKGTAYVTGSKITYQYGAEYKTTGMDTLGIGADFTTAPGAVPNSIQTDTAGRITSYKDAAGNTHSFTYESVDLSKLTEAERAALEKAAKQEGWTTENLTASLTRVSWKVESPRTEIPQTTPIENGETVNLVNDNNWSQTDHGNTVDFTHNGTTYAGMKLDNTSEDGKTKTYKKTEANGTVTIITVTTQQLDIKAQFDKKFGENNYKMDATAHTVTYTGEDGKTYKASYVDWEEKLTVEVQKPQVVAATGSTEAEAQTKFLNELEEARLAAEKDGETLVIEYTKDGKIKNLVVDRKMTWDEVVVVVGHVVNYNAMTNAELVEYLNALKTDAQNTGKYYDGSASYWGTTPYYRDAAGKMQRVPKGATIYKKYGISYVKIDGKEHKVHYDDNYIAHLDLATDSKLTLSEKEKDGTAKIDDCVLLNPTLTWHENAETLVNKKGKQANFVDRITYDNEADDNDDTGHYEYPRASWDNKNAKNNAPTKSVFYKVTGQVAYGKLGGKYEATPTGGRHKDKYTEEDYAAAQKRAEDALAKYRAENAENSGLDLSNAQVVKIYTDQTKGGGHHYYQIYLYQSDLTAYGYMSDDNNTCGNALFNADGQSYYVGGYDLTLGSLTQTDKKHVVAMGKNTIALSATFKRRKLEERLNKALNYTPISVTETIIHESEVTGQGTDLSGSYQANYTKTEDYTDEQQKGIEGTGNGSYKSFTNLIRNIFNGDGKGTVEGGFIKYEYHTEKDKEGNPVPFEAKQMVVTTKQDAEVHYTFTSQESRDVWIKGYTQTVVPPVNPGPDTPELPPVEDAKPAPAPAPAPETPVLPVVQDARPDPAPTPAPAPETPVLPAVQDAKLIQTGTSGWLADLMLGAGMVLSAAGYWMERKRKAMFYKSQH